MADDDKKDKLRYRVAFFNALQSYRRLRDYRAKLRRFFCNDPDIKLISGLGVDEAMRRTMEEQNHLGNMCEILEMDWKTLKEKLDEFERSEKGKR